jgi:hypothetical protein
MPRPKTAASVYKRLTLRLPEDVLEVLQQQAATIGRPVNTHALFVLRYGLAMNDVSPIPGGLHGSRQPRKS